MTVPEKIVGFLRKHRTQAVCDDCLFKELDLKQRQEVQPVTATLALCSGFSRLKGQCSVCGSNRPKYVTKAM
jgi:hypothetical protein